MVTTTTLFHDSLTIWGYAYNNSQCTPLFNGSLLKQIRGWRSSVQWPYGKGDHMQFYAISPAYESLNLKVTAPICSGGTFTPPTFTYTLPETAGEMRDLLYGTGHVESIAAGPAGSTTDNPKAENLGKDNKTIDLHFQHLLTAIRFAQGSIPSGITVKSITLRSIYSQGIYNPADDDAATGTKGAWSIPEESTKHSYTLTTNFSGTGTTNTYIDNNQVFLVIPHTLNEAEDATLEIEIEAPQHYKVDENGMYTPLDGDREAADENTPRTTHILTCSLTNDVWKKGYTVTYMLTIGQVADGYYLIAEQPEALSHDETNGHFTLHSYRSYFDYSNSASGTEDFSHAVDWKVVGYSNSEPTSSTPFNDTKPQWLNDGLLTSSTAQIGGYATNIPFTLKPQEATQKGNHADNLVTNSSVAADKLDLSWYSPNAVGEGKESHRFSSQQPSNCYIINRQGNYKFPLIYGNGNISEGINFVDHTGTPIANQRIHYQMTATKNASAEYILNDDLHAYRHEYRWTPSHVDVQIVWQDVAGLISSVGKDLDSEYISFTTNPTRPGNAVIALKARKVRVNYTRTSNATDWKAVENEEPTLIDGGNNWETLWTWHIWATDEVYPNDGTNADAQFLNYNSPNGDHIVSLYEANGTTEKAKILPVNLGWVPDEMKFSYYEPRTVWVKLQQVVDNEDCPTTVVKIQQHARQPLVTGTSTVYQWGRPTALPALRHMDMTARPVYGASGSTDISGSFTVQNITAPGEAISNPLALCRTSSDGGTWFDTSGTVPAYWGSGSSTTKTIYDPCPPGFYIPYYGIFTGFRRTGATADDGSSLNMWEDAGQHGKGAYFYTTPNTTSTTTDRYGQTVYMPATGQYSADHPEGTEMNTTISHEDTNAGQVWGSDSGKALWFYPQWERTESEGKAIQLPRTVPFSTAIPVRPAGSLPAY